MEKRKANFELLRIIAMLMIVCLHYLSKGKLLSETFSISDLDGISYWLIEAFCIVAVNSYVIMSGYFRVDKGFNIKNIIKIWMQVLFYSIMIPLILIIFNVINIEELNIYRISIYFFPIISEHYWFITYFILLMLIAPILNAGLKNLSQKDARNCIIGMIILLSVAKSVLPIEISFDKSGYDLSWFVCLYLIGGYIKLYGIRYFSNLSKSVITYMGLSVITMVIMLVYSEIGKSVAAIDKVKDNCYDYNHIIVLMASIAFFYIFYYIRVNGRFLANIITKISPYVLGVFLLHEHIELRYLWVEWANISAEGSILMRTLHMIITILVIFICGVLVEYIRVNLYSLVSNVLSKSLSTR